MSSALYLFTLTFEVHVRNWPGEGTWFFNPFAWQFLLVLGFAAAVLARGSAHFRAVAERLIPLGALIVALGCASVLFGITPDPYEVPEPRLLFLLEKSFLSPARLVEFLALALAFHTAFPIVSRMLGKLVGPISQLGRNSLEVFAVGSIMALLAQIVRATLQPNIFLDAALVTSGILVMVFTAWLSEWRSRYPRSS